MATYDEAAALAEALKIYPDLTATEILRAKAALEEGSPAAANALPSRHHRSPHTMSKEEFLGWFRARVGQMAPGDVLTRGDIYLPAGWGYDGGAYLLLGHTSLRGLNAWLGRRAVDLGLVIAGNSLSYRKPELRIT